MQVRDERCEDAAAISRITAGAFAQVSHSSGTEPRIVDALRHAGALTISLVAVSDDGRIVGHVAFSPVRIDRNGARWYGLGPVSVTPQMQRQGIGRALIREGLARLAALDADGCVVLGDPAYYGCFGFVRDPALTYGGEPSPYFQRLVLKGMPPARGCRIPSGVRGGVIGGTLRVPRVRRVGPERFHRDGAVLVDRRGNRPCSQTNGGRHAQPSRSRKPPQLSASRVSGGSPSPRKPMLNAGGASFTATSS